MKKLKRTKKSSRVKMKWIRGKDGKWEHLNPKDQKLLHEMKRINKS